MKKTAALLLILILLSCKTTKHKCDAYGANHDDIFNEHVEEQKKYISSEVIK